MRLAVASRGFLPRCLRPGARTLCSAPDLGFAKLGLRPELVEATRLLGCTTPSPVQAMAIPKLLAGRSVAVASSTGSGKTLAYLLPMFERLKAQEDARPEMKAELKPRAVILVRDAGRASAPRAVDHIPIVLPVDSARPFHASIYRPVALSIGSHA